MYIWSVEADQGWPCALPCRLRGTRRPMTPTVRLQIRYGSESPRTTALFDPFLQSYGFSRPGNAPATNEIAPGYSTVGKSADTRICSVPIYGSRSRATSGAPDPNCADRRPGRLLEHCARTAPLASRHPGSSASTMPWSCSAPAVDGPGPVRAAHRRRVRHRWPVAFRLLVIRVAGSGSGGGVAPAARPCRTRVMLACAASPGCAPGVRRRSDLRDLARGRGRVDTRASDQGYRSIEFLSDSTWVEAFWAALP